MVLGFLGGLILGCLIGTFNALFWYSVGPLKDSTVRVNVYVGTSLIVIGSAITGALFGMVLGW